MDPITDEYMLQMLPKAKAYTAVILKPGPKAGMEGADKIKWEHGRRNFSLRAEGKLSIVCPVFAPQVNGIGIFDLSLEETRAVMDSDPGVVAGTFIYEAYPCRSFPGDALP